MSPLFLLFFLGTLLEQKFEIMVFMVFSAVPSVASFCANNLA